MFEPIWLLVPRLQRYVARVLRNTFHYSDLEIPQWEGTTPNIRVTPCLMFYTSIPSNNGPKRRTFNRTTPGELKKKVCLKRPP